MYLVHIRSLNFISLQNKNKLHSRFFDKINMNFTTPARYRHNYMEASVAIMYRMQKKLTMKILFLDQNYEPCLGSDTINATY